jgi:hypothetical protein
MKCTRCSNSLLMKCTLRDSRSSLETIRVSGPNGEAFARPKGFDLVTLRRESQAAAALFLSADSQVSDCCLHRGALP